MTQTDVREQVSRAYAEALKKSKAGTGGCCGPAAAACGTSVAPAGAGVAGYGDDAKSKHSDAAASSFGCGNPLAFAGVVEGQTVLDLGSGAGLDLLIAAEKVGPTGRVIGVDMTDNMIQAARENAAKAGYANVEIRKGFIEELPVEDASVDWVISNCVINLSPDKPTVFREIARVMRPGARFSVSDIVADDLPEAIREHAAAYSACVAGAISEGDYAKGLRDAGLADVEITERHVYDESQLRALVASDLENFGIDAATFDTALGLVAGKVASVKVIGRKG
ncbi:arsenite methyltransferase [bacterium]|nr:arsenite methyltransferase [bacterium]